MSDPFVGVHEAFDRVHDGAKIIDSAKTALALFVTMDGEVQLKSPYPKRQVAAILRQIADKTEARADGEEV